MNSSAQLAETILIGKVKREIETLDKRTVDAYRIFFEIMLGGIKKDFLTGVSYYKSTNSEFQVVRNDIDKLKSLAKACGLKVSDIEFTLSHFLDHVEPSWIVEIPKWDGVDRIREIAETTKIKNTSVDSFYEHILDWGAGVFRRAGDHFAQNKIVILRGPQGIGKDFFIKTICKGFGTYFGQWVNTRDQREMVMMMQRSLILNIPEFDSTHQNEVSILKDIITRYEATYRAPYAREATTVKLRTSFISSSNATYLLRDSTGNRRFVVFDIEKFGLVKKFDDFDGPQIVSQFKHAFETGFRVGEGHQEAMTKLIGDLTPPCVEDEILSYWNSEILSGQAFSGRRASWLSVSEVDYILRNIRKEFGVSRQRLVALLQSKGCRTRDMNGIKYRAELHLSSVQKDQKSVEN